MAASRRVRAAWIVGGSMFTVATLGFGTLQAVAGLAHEERTVRTVIDTPIDAVQIEASGSVTVLGSDADSVTIEEHVSDGLQRPDRSVQVELGVLVVRGTCGEVPATFCGDDFVLRVPRSMRVIARAEGVSVSRVRGGADLIAEGGDIRVRDVAGRMRLRSQGGGITARALDAAKVAAESYGGDIKLSFVSPPRNVSASSHGGNISVALPDGPLAYRVDASALGGSTETPIRTDPNSSRVIRAESFGGGVSIRYGNG